MQSNKKGDAMESAKALVTDRDMLELAQCLEERSRWPGPEGEAVQALQRKMNRAGVLRNDAIPPDVITLNSRVRVTNLDDAADATHTLVMPARSSTARDAISVLHPMGAALLGRRRGHEVEVPLRSGLMRLKVEDVVYQPEAAAQASARERIEERGT
jgi:regulator of nucleoside diphosphate kinase